MLCVYRNWFLCVCLDSFFITLCASRVVAAAANTREIQTGSTALHLAAASGRADCVRLLLEVGADKEAQNKVCSIMHGIELHREFLVCLHKCLRRFCVLVSYLLVSLFVSVRYLAYLIEFRPVCFFPLYSVNIATFFWKCFPTFVNSLYRTV